MRYPGLASPLKVDLSVAYGFLELPGCGAVVWSIVLIYAGLGGSEKVAISGDSKISDCWPQVNASSRE